MATRYNYPIPTNTNLWLTNRMVGYANEKTIWREIAPLTKVPNNIFNYKVYNKKDSFTVPENMAVGKLGSFPKIYYSWTSAQAETKDYGLSADIYNDDIYQARYMYANSGDDLKAYVTKTIVDIADLRVEKECAALVFDSANYASGNYSTLTTGGTSGGYWWSDYTNSNPVVEILKQKRLMIAKPNVFVIGSLSWSYLSQHPKVIYHVYKSTTAAGPVTPQQFAAAFEFDKCLVGEAWVNTYNNKGQTASLVKAWTNKAAMLVVDKTVDTLQGMTFAMTASWQPQGFERLVYEDELKPMENGVEGGVTIGVGEHKSVIATASDYGYLWTDATAST